MHVEVTRKHIMRKHLVLITSIFLAVGFASIAAAEEATVSGGDVIQQGVNEEQETNKWAMIYGSVTFTPTLTDGAEEDVFTWESGDVADGSAVLAVEQEDEQTSQLEAVDGEADINGVPTEGSDSFENTYTESAELSVLLGQNTDAAQSEQATSENLFAYTPEGTDNYPVWAGEVNNDELQDNQDYEVLVGQENDLTDQTYELYLELA